MRGRVILVEDEADARELLGRALTRAGVLCELAENAEQARRLAQQPFDAAVVDIVLGADERGGLRLIPELRRARGVIVVITAFADLDLVKTALNEGASYLLEKPFRAQELVEVLGRLLAERDDLSHFVDRALLDVSLTDKELVIARLVLKGLPTAEIARLEGNSDKTVRQHLTQIYAKCGVASRAELFHYVFPS
ncbi:MAG: response regulator transcription factor [Myxococcales bacterium]